MRLLIKTLISTLAILVSAYIVPGVVVQSFTAALLLAVALSFLNLFFKPVFILLTLPITLFSFGLFLIFVNTFMVLIADWMIDSVTIGGFWNAFLFSLLMWLVNSLFERIQKRDDSTTFNEK